MFSPNGRQHPLDLAEDALDGGARRLHQYFVSMVLKAANIHAKPQQEDELAIAPPLDGRREDRGRLLDQARKALHPHRVVDLLPLSGTGGG